VGEMPPDPLTELGRIEAGADHDPSGYLGTAAFSLDRWVAEQLKAAQILGLDTTSYHQAAAWAAALRHHWHPAVRLQHGQPITKPPKER
jgi:aminoglycoside phosphotransferase (APT) family kinase protein